MGSADRIDRQRAIPIAGIWFACTAVYSFMSGLVNLRRGEQFNGVLQTFFGVFFFGGFGFTFLVGVFKGINFIPLLGYALLPLAAILSSFTPGVWKASKVFGASLIAFDLGLLIQGVANLAGEYYVADVYGGWFIGIAGFIMLYGGIALVVNTTAERTILPMI
jgi:hypothetical protein